MDNLTNSFKAALKKGEPQIGLWVGLADAYCAEICAGAGFDWLLIDGEHAPNDLRSLLAQLQAVAAYGVHPVVRPPVGEPWLLKQILDIGAQSLLIPMVETAEQARALVAATRYAPQGIRGIGYGMARSGRWSRTPDYVHRAGDETCLLVQIETKKALDNIEEIAAVEGVDGLFIGPADLSAALGFPGNSGHPDFQAVVESAMRRVIATGKPVGIVTGDETLNRKYLEIGCTFVAVGVDAILFAKMLQELAGRYKTSRPASI